jgi:hypothetical protein
LETIEESKKSLLIILDDINGLAQTSEFAHWYKSIVDEIATGQVQLPLLLMLIGLTERCDALIEKQPSLSRVFTLIDVKPLSLEETKEFYGKTFSSVNISIDPKALELVSKASGGLPMLIHEIGDAVFWVNPDDKIDNGDALKGIFTVAEIVGRKHIDPRIYSAIRSEKYKPILKEMFRDPVVTENFAAA